MTEARRKTYIRLDPDLYERIEESARHHRRSVNAEMEFRLEESIRNEPVRVTGSFQLGSEVAGS